MEVSAEVERIFQETSPDIEVKVRMVNINYGHNMEILYACKPLEEYAWFVAQVRNNLAESKNGDATRIGNAIDKVIDEMSEDFEIKKFITANRAEVKDMCLTEYNEAETMEMLWQEAIQEGLQEGMQQGMQQGMHEMRLLDIKNLMDVMGWTAEKAMDALKIPLNQRDSLYAGLSKNA